MGEIYGSTVIEMRFSGVADVWAVKVRCSAEPPVLPMFPLSSHLRGFNPLKRIVCRVANSLDFLDGNVFGCTFAVSLCSHRRLVVVVGVAVAVADVRRASGCLVAPR